MDGYLLEALLFALQELKPCLQIWGILPSRQFGSLLYPWFILVCFSRIWAMPHICQRTCWILKEVFTSQYQILYIGLSLWLEHWLQLWEVRLLLVQHSPSSNNAILSAASLGSSDGWLPGHDSHWKRLRICCDYGYVEGLYFTATIMKVAEGGWVPLVLAFLCMLVMYVWHYGTAKKYEFDLQNKASMKWILTLGPSLGIVRVRGIGLIYTELVTGVPAIFSHFVTNLPAFHQVLVFVCVKTVHMPYVTLDERYVIGRIGPKEYRMYRCIVRHGYKDIRKEEDDFENQLVANICEYIQREAEHSTTSIDDSDDGQLTVIGSLDLSALKMVVSGSDHDNTDDADGGSQLHTFDDETMSSLQSLETVLQLPSSQQRRRKVRFELPQQSSISPAVRDEMYEVIEASKAGMAYFLGHSCVRTKKGSSFLKRLAIDFGYSFLRENCRGSAVALGIPHNCLVQVGMIYYV
ncbi:hypothetical protein GOP47_0013310 [Adiantum capillus-veneris]|uniref:Potassium transporter n=1 Tax=Adiantum capillus-veneris TaxID=13818 RepID=A0A9D4UNA5_ADICA|nr:hypothetical protein GOP47_0013310 [Adiantum capillus-veneris]